MAETIDTLRTLIAETCAVDRNTVRGDGKLVGFGLDSVRLLDLILAIEERFGVEISESDPELARVETVTDLVTLIERRRGRTG